MHCYSFDVCGNDIIEPSTYCGGCEEFSRNGSCVINTLIQMTTLYNMIAFYCERTIVWGLTILYNNDCALVYLMFNNDLYCCEIPIQRSKILKRIQTLNNIIVD